MYIFYVFEFRVFCTVIMLNTGMKRIKLILLGYLLHSTVCAQYAIQLTVKNTSDSVVYFRMASFDNKLFIPKDTFRLSKQPLRIQSTTPIYGGFYYLYFPQSKKKIWLCLENKDRFNLNIDGEKWEQEIVCSDPKNILFFHYQIIENSFLSIDSNYNEMRKRGNGNLKTKESLYKDKILALTAFRLDAMKKLSTNSLLYKYFNCLNRLDAYVPNKKNFKEREEFLQQFNLKDPQLYFSPLLKDVMYEYLSSYPLSADSTLKGMSVIMKKLNCKDKIYPNTFNYFASILQNSSIKENTKGFTSFIEKYLINTTCQFLPKSTTNEFLSLYSSIKKIAVVDTAMEMRLKDSSGNLQSLHNQIKNADYTVISFYDPTCEHCKYQIPILDSTLKSVRAQTSLSVLHFAICNTSIYLENEWKKFILENKLGEHTVHVILGEEESIRNAYAAYNNPIFFLVDKNGSLLLKKTTITAIKQYLISIRR